MMISSKLGGNFECCMCGDCGLSYELFRCKVCQFRSQHRYCSNLYPNAQSYRVCNWCLIQKEENHHHHQTNSSSNNSSNNSSSPALKTPTSTTSTSQHQHQHQHQHHHHHHQEHQNNNNPFAVKKKNTRKSCLLYDSNINDHNGSNNSGTKNNIYKLRPPGSPIKKQRSPDAALSSPSSHRARRPNANNTTLINGAAQTHDGLKRTIIRRTKSDEMSNNKDNANGNLTPNSSISTVAATRPHVFRNKVRRYKLLEEVSS